jgi:hypothetical protein
MNPQRQQQQQQLTAEFKWVLTAQTATLKQPAVTSEQLSRLLMW